MSDTNSSQNSSLASSATLDSAGAAVSGGYEGSSFTLQVLIILFPTLTIYNSVELLILILFTFTKFRGLYFWSLTVSSVGLIPYALGFLLKFDNITPGSDRWLSVTLLTIGWYAMVTGQSVVLWSRLHLVVAGERGQQILRWTKWMIIVDAIILHIPTTVLTYGSNGRVDTKVFADAYSIMEKIQMSGFFVQEMILSGIYVWETVRTLNTSVREHTRLILLQLLGINILIMMMDMALLGIEAASLYIFETLLKGVFYSIKLKLEFAILGRLVLVAGGRPGTSMPNEPPVGIHFSDEDDTEKSKRHLSRSSNGTTFAQGDISDFVDISKVRTDVTHAARNPIAIDNIDASRHILTNSVRLRPGMTRTDIELAIFQHGDVMQIPASPPPQTTNTEIRDFLAARKTKSIGEIESKQ